MNVFMDEASNKVLLMNQVLSCYFDGGERGRERKTKRGGDFLFV